jgi:hypothetical protein
MSLINHKQGNNECAKDILQDQHRMDFKFYILEQLLNMINHENHQAFYLNLFLNMNYQKSNQQ